MYLGNGIGRVLVEDKGDGPRVPALTLELLVRTLHNMEDIRHKGID